MQDPFNALANEIAEATRGEHSYVFLVIEIQRTLRRVLAERLQSAEAVCEAIDGRHPIALGDRVGVLPAAWKKTVTK